MRIDRVLGLPFDSLSKEIAHNARMNEQPVKSDTVMTVASLLEVAPLRRGVPELVAGEGGIDRVVRWVHAGEVPNIASLLRGGEVLLSTGIAVERSAAAERRFVRELAERGLAALAIELGPRFATLPAAMRDEADRHGLPLIALHNEVPFVDITEAAHREIVNRQFELMRRGDALHRSFTSLMIEGADIPAVLDALAKAIGNPVVLERTGQGVLYHAPGARDDASTLEAWDRVARGLDGAVAIAEQPVPVGGERHWGRLVALGLDSPLDDHDRFAVERAVGLIALALLRDREDERVVGRERGNFLVALLDGSVEDDTAARTRAAAMGFSARGPMLALVAGPRRAGRQLPADESAWRRALAELRRGLAERHLRTLVGTQAQDHELLAIVELPRRRSRAQVMEQIAAVAREAAARQLHDADGIVLCASGVADGWGAVRDGLAAAARELPAAAWAPPRAWHDAEAADLERLLCALRDSPELRRFTEASLRPLADHDARRSTKLLVTLAAYCESGGRKSEAARALGIERQSLYHRLARIEQLLGVDLSSGDTMLGLHLAVRVRAVLAQPARSSSS